MLADATLLQQIFANIWEIILLCSLLAIQSILSTLRSKKHKRETSDKLDSISTEVKETKKELSTNGGDTTIKDVINKMHINQAGMNVKLDRCSSDIYLMCIHLSSLVTDRQKRELELNNSIEAQYIANEDGDVDFANSSMIALFGMNAGHLMKKKRFNCVLTQEEKRRLNDDVKYNVTEKLDFSMPYTIINRQTDELIQVLETFEAKRNKEGQFLWFEGKIKPISN